MRDRLIELIKDAKDEYPTVPTINCCKAEFANFLADRLLENGVIVPPCWFGDTLYRIVTSGTGVKRKIVKHEHGKLPEVAYIKTQKRYVRKIVVTKNNFFDVCDGFGKTVFPTREEAKQALKGKTP